MTKVAQKNVDGVVAANPLLTAEGFEHGFKRTRPEYIPAGVNVKQMQGAVNWLQQAGRRVTVNTSCSSYGLAYVLNCLAPVYILPTPTCFVRIFYTLFLVCLALQVFVVHT